VTPAAVAQPVPLLGLAAPEVCDSPGRGEDLGDIDTVLVPAFGHIGEVDSQAA
jgi:hypothetical protein